MKDFVRTCNLDLGIDHSCLFLHSQLNGMKTTIPREFLPLYALIPESTETPAPVKTATFPGLKNAAIRFTAEDGEEGVVEEGKGERMG